MSPLGGNLRTAYEFYRKPNRKASSTESINRFDTMPPLTTITTVFKGTIDHIFYNKESLKLLELLEVPEDLDEDEAMPNLEYPSDHFRIEAKFYIPA